MDIQKIIGNFLDGEGRLRSFPAKRKTKIYALMYYASKFEPNRLYSESEVNAIVDRFSVFHDPETVRRELINYHFMGRPRDGSAYWLEKEQPTLSRLGLE